MSNSDKISEKKYKKLAYEMEMILDNIPGLVFYKDTKNNLIRVNKYFADSHKLNKKELEGKSCFDLYPKEQAQAYWDDDLEVINSGKPKLNILEPWEIESGVRWLSTNKIPFFNDKRKCIGIIGFSKDVTEEIKAELKLKEYSGNLEDLVEQRTLNLKKQMEENQLYLDVAGVMLLVIDADETIKHINKKGCEILVCDEEQLIGKNWFDKFIPKENRKEIKSVFRKLMAGEMKPVEYYENPILTKEGKEKLIAWHNTVLKDEIGNIIGTLSSGEDITERKKAEQTLKENSEFIQNVFNAIQDGLSVLDLDLNILKVNPYMTEMYGPIDQIVNRKCYDVYQKRSSPCPWCPSIKTIETGQLNTSIVPYPSSENPTGWIELTAFPLKNSDGNVEGVIESVKDITERRKMMEELRIKDIIFNASLSAQSTADLNGIIDHVNPAFLELWGYKTKEEAIGNSVGSFFENPDDAVPVLKALTETGKWEGEFLAKRIDGSTFISQGFASTIFNENGELIGFQSANLNVTKHREAEKKLHLEREYLLNILNSMEDGIYIVDKNCDIEYVNPILTQEFGRYEGKKCYTYFHDLNEPCLWCKNKEVFEGKTVRWEWYSFKNQKTYDLIDTPLRNPDGSLSKLEIFRDITKIKKAEQDLLSTLENLKSVNIELERFAYVASHDLQEPLRMIVSFIQLLEKRYKDKLDEDADEFIAFIVDGAKRMQSLINDLLIYSRVGRKEKQLSHLDINILINTVINNLKKSIVETNTQITYDPLPKLIGNEIELIQLLQNLISNAIKFHKEEEPPVVHISAKLKKNQWIFSVSDNGIGIDSQYFDRIFIIFQRLHKKDEFGGTGIGLTICKKIVERHSGKIWVESKLGKGSTFYFSIPKTEVRK